jgi:hypothetical protein
MNLFKNINISEKKKEFDSYGATVFGKDEFLFSDIDWQKIYNIIEDQQLPMESIEIGDVGEPNRVEVARFVTDVEKPKVVNHQFSEPLLDIIYSDQIKKFFEKFFGLEELFLRRCQLNIIGKNGFIGKHLDCDSNPDYLSAIIMHFDDGFDGGEFYYYPNNNAELIECQRNCIIVSSCLIEHEVKKVLDGRRRTLVFFLSEEPGKNRSTKLIMK